MLFFADCDGPGVYAAFDEVVVFFTCYARAAQQLSAGNSSVPDPKHDQPQQNQLLRNELASVAFAPVQQLGTGWRRASAFYNSPPRTNTAGICSKMTKNKTKTAAIQVGKKNI